MSIILRMSLVMNLLSLLLSTAIVYSNQSTMPLRSFKMSENVTYDCIDIHKQPGLNHPYLKTHKIQMKPSLSRPELKMRTEKNETSNQNKIGCPNGTVPILRSTKEFIINSQMFAENNFHMLSADSPGTHIAGVRSSSGPFRGVKAYFSAYKLNVGKDQVSYSQIYVGSGSGSQVNYISAGWTINPGLYGDQRVWTFGFWKGKDGKGCYNTACSGFVQVSKVVPIVQPNDLKPGVPGFLDYFIHQDKNTGNWWITRFSKGAPSVDIGYWPKELFNLLDNGANMAGVGGVVQASRSGSIPPMGNGNFPNGGRLDSAIFTNIEVLNSNYEQRKMNSFHVDYLVDSEKCYGLKVGKKGFFYKNPLGFYFNYGGPGGNSCGV
ncbi:hypothetical protein IGI04_008411 [Brassica rapa subsp. trilocularis]|uniref:Neprosin PEP catalytic domain-containing protein n=1 Tax=Brassica rapa subsp. trilocularis TaxID=1813537 RepID=A0ABQ7NMJ9_BRACM|nr:hypothetical protein IGI04_008411 [Brassica rapa subsp. trilocularis]